MLQVNNAISVVLDVDLFLNNYSLSDSLPNLYPAKETSKPADYHEASAVDSIDSAETFAFKDTTHHVTDTVSPLFDSAEQSWSDIFKAPGALAQRNAYEIIGFDMERAHVSWAFNPTYLSFEEILVDTVYWMNHQVFPQQKKFESFSYLGYIASPSQYDHFFTRPTHNHFIFTKNYHPYLFYGLSHNQYNVRSPFTVLYYSTGGQHRVAEQIFKVTHTQNVNRYFNFGVDFDHYSTKGKYTHQESRYNSYAFYANYFKGNLSAQAVIANNGFRNQESGGVADQGYITDSLYTPRLVPFELAGQSKPRSETKYSSISANIGYTFLNIKTQRRDTLGEMVDSYIPLLSSRIIVENSTQSRTYTDYNPTNEFHPNVFISPVLTQDSASLSSWDITAMVEVLQFARIPGMPGLRGWVAHQSLEYYNFEPTDFIFSRSTPRLTTSHIGIGTYSHSPFLSYEGALRVFVKGYKAEDKELDGRIRFSPWRDSEMPQLIGSISITEREPSMFLNRYYSNHFQWDNNFDKEKRFRLQGALRAERWWTEIGYNLMHISDYHYFDTSAHPAQESNITITSAYIQNNLSFFGINFANRLVWQANTNQEVLNLPQLMLFSSLFYERLLVPNALTGQLGVSVYYRSNFFADAYSPATGQFYNQRERQIGMYPHVDVFLNFKWKRATLFFKYEHFNQGYPNLEYFATYNYPMDPRVFKYGLSWIFYD